MQNNADLDRKCCSYLKMTLRNHTYAKAAKVNPSITIGDTKLSKIGSLVAGKVKVIKKNIAYMTKIITRNFIRNLNVAANISTDDRRIKVSF